MAPVLLLLVHLSVPAFANFPPLASQQLPLQPQLPQLLSSNCTTAMTLSHHFRIVTTFNTTYTPHRITKYESERTGMTVVVVDREGPKVRGQFALATEILDDSGAPHTLEHLVFMGSRGYQYKGVLDRMATRAYSETNAWTATDHTAYTLDTAGWAGFRQILPVYLEHILAPTLTDSGCYTEVHHVDGTGHDAGVVFSEMQGVQNTQDSLMNEAGVKMLYPDGIGFRYETGGLMEALRVLTADRIREFHKSMYQPKNLCLVVIGEVDHKELLETLETFEDSIIDIVPPISQPWKRPWVDSKPVPQLSESKSITVEFPEKDESTGEVMVAFFGPSCLDSEGSAAVDVLDQYFAGSSVSVLEKEMVEIEDPWASSSNFFTEERPNTVIWIQLTAVKTSKLEAAEKRLHAVLRETVEKPLDLDYLKQIVRRLKRQIKFYTETSAGVISRPIITDHLFGKRDGSDLRQLETLDAYDQLLKWTEGQWSAFIRKWLVDNKHVSVLGRPSAKLKEKIEADDKALVEKRVRDLGEEGLKELQKRLEDAKAENEREIPKEMIQKFKVPGVDTIHFIKTETARGGLARKLDGPAKAPGSNQVTDAQVVLDKDSPADIPLYLHFESAATEFVRLNLFLNTESIPIKLRPLLPIYFNNFFSTPVMKDGVRIEYEKVVSQLEEDTVSYEIRESSNTDQPETIRVRLQVELEKYREAIQSIKTLLWDSIFDKKRLGVLVAKLRSDIPDEKRDGNNMCFSVNKMIALSEESISRAKDTLVKSLYLKRIESLLRDDPDEAIKQFEELRKSLTIPENMRVLVVADLNKLKDPVSSWKDFLGGAKPSKVNPLDRRLSRLSPTGLNPGNTAHIVPLPNIDSSFSLHVVKGPSSLDDPSLPALILALSFLGVTEGPLWKATRGPGLAYGVQIYRIIEDGQLRLFVYRSPDAYKAFAAVKDTIQDYVDGKLEFDDAALEGALSSVVVQFADNEPNVSGAATMGWVYQVVHGVGKDYNSSLLKKVKAVTKEELRKVLKEKLTPLFVPEASNVVVICSEVKKEAIRDAFVKDGFKAEIKSLKSFESDYGVKYGVKEGEEEEASSEEGGSEEGSEESAGED